MCASLLKRIADVFHFSITAWKYHLRNRDMTIPNQKMTPPVLKYQKKTREIQGQSGPKERHHGNMKYENIFNNQGSSGYVERNQKVDRITV